ncbi:MAG: hypothetical protein JRJ15_13825 [Deltaproteobacteria bacterium]|nr:hypothetical protein [Deltaproteobacteria bacterium]
MGNRRIKTTFSELRDYDERGINDFDLIVIGSPVFYYDTPSHVKAFMNMGAYPPSWSGEKVSENTWNNRYLPNEETYNEVRAYADG